MEVNRYKTIRTFYNQEKTLYKPLEIPLKSLKKTKQKLLGNSYNQEKTLDFNSHKLQHVKILGLKESK